MLHGVVSTQHIVLIHLLCLIPSSKHLCHCKLRIGIVKATVLVRLHLAVGQNGRHRAFLQSLGSLLKDVADLLGLLTGHIEEQLLIVLHVGLAALKHERLTTYLFPI